MKAIKLSLGRFLFAASLLLAAPGSSFAGPPPLTIVVVVDQLRADYLQRFSNEFIGGFARLSRDGAVFSLARHGHVPTETAPGHAALLTGCFPGQHGIVGNHWWDRTSGRSVYAVEDDKFGRSPRTLLCPSVGDILKEGSPQSKVFSIAGKDRSAILMGGRHPNAALWYDPKSGQFTTSAYYPGLPQWAKAWSLRHDIPADRRSDLLSTSLLDSMTLDLSKTAIEEENLGKRAVPDFLSVSLSATDYIGHQNGPDSLQIHNQLLFLDRELGAFLDYLDLRFGRAGYALFLSADHGVLPVPESPAGKAMGAVRVSKDELKDSLEASLRKRFGAPNGPGQGWVLSIWEPHVYLNFDLGKKLGVNPADLRKEASRILSENPAVRRVFAREELSSAEKTTDPVLETYRRSFLASRAGDLLFSPREGVLISDSKSGTGHGSPYEYDSHVPLILFGSGILQGRYKADVLAEDLAPTAVCLMGFSLKAGSPIRVLEEALKSGGNCRKAGSSLGR